ncbi:MAG: hypothetical protein U0361_08480 [Nitrospiraceae bacterium]
MAMECGDTAGWADTAAPEGGVWWNGSGYGTSQYGYQGQVGGYYDPSNPYASVPGMNVQAPAYGMTQPYGRRYGQCRTQPYGGADGVDTRPSPAISQQGLPPQPGYPSAARTGHGRAGSTPRLSSTRDAGLWSAADATGDVPTADGSYQQQAMQGGYQQQPMQPGAMGGYQQQGMQGYQQPMQGYAQQPVQGYPTPAWDAAAL